MLPQKRIETMIRDALELPDDFALDEELRPANVPGWDSLGWLAILAAAEQDLGTEIPLDALEDVSTLGDFYSVLSRL